MQCELPLEIVLPRLTISERKNGVDAVSRRVLRHEAEKQ